MGQIRKINKKQEGKNGGTKKKRICYRPRGSHTHVFSISWECPRATALIQPYLRRTHSYENLPYNKETIVLARKLHN
jgi:hypothetical protein